MRRARAIGVASTGVRMRARGIAPRGAIQGGARVTHHGVASGKSSLQASQAYQERLIIGNMQDPCAHGLWNCVIGGLKDSQHYECFQAIGAIANWKAGL